MINKTHDKEKHLIKETLDKESTRLRNLMTKKDYYNSSDIASTASTTIVALLLQQQQQWEH